MRGAQRLPGSSVRVHRVPRRLRALLARGEDPAFTRSKLEAAVLDMTRTARLPKPQTNVLLCGYEVDFYFRAAGVVLEVDGYAYHSSRASFEADRRRDMAMEAEGYRVIRVTWRQIRKERDAVLARLAQALAQAGARNGPGQI